MRATTNQEADLADEIVKYTWDPLGFQRFAYPWGEGTLKNSPGPRSWQAKVSDHIGQHLRNPLTRYQPCLIAVASGHDIGKSAEVSMLSNWAMSTCEDCKVLLTANTDTQLRTKTWPEVDKWYKLAINGHWFQVNAESISCRQKGHERLWKMDRVAWSDNNTEAFAGLHNLGKRILVIFDEASAISDKIWEVTEGALTDEKTEIIWICFGNPTRNEGRFRECFGKFSHRWKTFQIDSRAVDGTNKAQLDKFVEDYGEDSDFVRVRIRGEFPRAATDQFIPSDIVQAARTYRAMGHDELPKIMAVDVARFGADQSTIGCRQGRKFELIKKFRGLSTVELASRVIEQIELERPDACVVDGDGVGGGVVDHLKMRGYEVFEFHGMATPDNPTVYFNKRAECWGLGREWLKNGAQMTNDPELAEDLTIPTYGFSSKQQIQLERKDDIKKRGFRSPDCGDNLMMTFAVKLSAKKPINTHLKVYAYPGQLGQSWMN